MESKEEKKEKNEEKYKSVSFDTSLSSNNSTSQSSSSSSSSDIARRSKEKDGGEHSSWTCEACTFIIESKEGIAHAACPVCLTPRPFTWRCDYCTCINHHVTNYKCIACEKENRNLEKRKVMRNMDNSWNCPQCNNKCAPLSRKCFDCGMSALEFDPMRDDHSAPAEERKEIDDISRERENKQKIDVEYSHYSSIYGTYGHDDRVWKNCIHCNTLFKFREGDGRPLCGNCIRYYPPSSSSSSLEMKKDKEEEPDSDQTKSWMSCISCTSTNVVKGKNECANCIYKAIMAPR
jgi:hypothetical protein